MDPSPGRSEMGEESSPLEPNRILRTLQHNEFSKDLEIFRTLINFKSRLTDGVDAERLTRWRPVIVQLLRSIASSEEVGEERVLLGSLAFVTLLLANCEFEDFKAHLRAYWNLEKPFLSAFGEDIEIRDREWFKLVIAHGYLKVNIKTIYASDIMIIPFEVIRRNCLGYTNYSYFAYKTLQSWLQKSAKTNFWHENNTSRTENELEAVIFSNWDSCICEIARRNATDVFPVYLKIMSQKYEGFSEFIFDQCVQNLSWQNVNKYTILTEVCNILKNIPKIVSSDVPACLFTSLTKNHLKHAGTKLYLTILKMLKGNEWESVFGESIIPISKKWEEERQFAAIQFLWEQWMKPTMEKFPYVFQYLWKNDSMKKLEVGITYLEKIGDRLGFELIYNGTNIQDVLNCRVEDFSEDVRLNAFSIVCQNKNWKYAATEDEPFAIVKRFLYFNIDTSSVTMRKGIIKNFEILMGNIQKFVVKRQDVDDCVKKNFDFYSWFHEFLLGCLDIGSTYQRKILALSLYKVVLEFVNRETLVELENVTVNPDFSKSNLIAYLTKATEPGSTINWKWKFIDKSSLTGFFRLLLDQMTDIREKSAEILTKYFTNQTTISYERGFLSDLATRYCNSSKFYEAASGSTMRRVLLSLTWKDDHESKKSGRVYLFLCILGEMDRQLKKMQQSRDILNCAVNGSPFFGSVMSILELPPLDVPAPTEAEMLLHYVEQAKDFFLSTLSLKAAQFEYSSSFEEMGQAIEESIRNSEVNEDTEECILSSSHQLVVSCIWMSLKVCCEAAAVIGASLNDDEKGEKTVKRVAGLIVSVLLKCRHKGAIEAAGLALAKLTRAVSTKWYAYLIEKHLSDLLRIDDKDNINLTRRGAGLSIMFHRIVSSDERKNRPMLHFSVKKLLDSLKTHTEDRSNQQGEYCFTDSSRARHLHFLRFVVADKSLQTQLVPYMEDICLTCFEYLRSPEWIVRNASLQLFGAIVPRLVGQCSARELDYGVGNSVDHFVTHFPILANSILTQLESLASAINAKNHRTSESLHIVSNVVPILTLFTKMSTGGCELVDYSSEDYISRAKRVFVDLFAHPVFHVRVLSSKAYAAFVALPDIPRALATMKLESVDDKNNNYQHAQLCSQIYLGRKLKHEMQCTSETFFVRRHKSYEAELKRGFEVQLRRLNLLLRHRLDCDEQHVCYTVYSALMRCLMESRTFLSDFNLRLEIDDTVVENFTGSPTQPGVAEFIKNLETFSDRYKGDASSLALELEAGRYIHDSTKRDDSSLLSRIREVSQKLHDDDVNARESVIDSIARLVEDSISGSYCSFVFDPRSEYSKLWIEVIIAILTIDDPEVRESMAKTLHPITRSIIGGSDRPVCPRAICHKIFNKLSLMWIQDPSEVMNDNVLEIFRRLTNSVKINDATEGLKSPFNQDENFHRDYASLLNILLYCVRTLLARNSPTGIRGIDSIEAHQINGIISVKKIEYENIGVDTTDLKINLQLSTSDYLSYKKAYLMRTIDEYRSMRGQKLIGDSNSP